MTQHNFSSRAVANGVELVCAASIQPEAIAWLWGGWLAAGKFHILAGPPGTGKTTLAMYFAATIANGGLRGHGWPDKSFAPAGNVVLWSGEDGIADTIIPRLLASGESVDRIFVVGETSENGRSRPFEPATDLKLLRNKICEIGNVRL
uniref:AAA family ATPase n=1 Tax=Collimonas silvisoli TaxID=2825884 RepID=UPI001B8AA629